MENDALSGDARPVGSLPPENLKPEPVKVNPRFHSKKILGNPLLRREDADATVGGLRLAHSARGEWNKNVIVVSIGGHAVGEDARGYVLQPLLGARIDNAQHRTGDHAIRS
jgi:hypothetical protein